MRILITGGAGFIGSHLALSLLRRGHEVRVLDNLLSQVHGAEPDRSPLFRSVREAVDFIRGDVRDRDAVIRSLRGMDTVVHLAAETGTAQSMYAINHYADVNIGGTAGLLDVIANERLSISRVIVASSRAVYGEGKYECQQDGIVFPRSRLAADLARGDFEVHCPICGAALISVATDEAARLDPTSVYGISKLTQEQLVLTVTRSLGISGLAFRYQNVYGPGQSLSNPYTGILSIFSTRIRNGNPINIFEDGKESRDFVYIDDVVEATQCGIEHSGPLVEAFNVGSGVATDVMTVSAEVQRALGRTTPTAVSGQFRLGDIRHNTADLTKIHATFGYTPSVSFGEGIQRFASWVTEEPVGLDLYDESMKELAYKALLK